MRINNQKIYEQIAEHMKEQIVQGIYAHGDKLPSTRELGESYQVGRSTIREALSALKAMGLVDIRQGEGCFVKKVELGKMDFQQWSFMQMNKETITELLEARKALEAANSALAAVRRTEEDLMLFKQILERMKMYAGAGDETEGEKADIEFHLTLAKATHNSIMVKLLETISGQMEESIRETRRLQMYADKAVSAELLKQHEQIVAAIEAKDAEQAEQRMKAHLRHVEQMLLPFLS